MLGPSVRRRKSRMGAARCAAFDRGSSTARMSSPRWPLPGMVMLACRGCSALRAATTLFTRWLLCRAPSGMRMSVTVSQKQSACTSACSAARRLLAFWLCSPGWVGRVNPP